MMQKKSVVLCAALVAVNLAFIWGNSMLPGEASSQISNGVLFWLKSHFPALDGLGGYFLRKIGHFCEFACLGLLLARLFSLLGQTGIHGVTMPLLFGLLAADVDETIQLFVPARSSALFDVWVDTLGICTGITLLFIGYAIGKRKRKKGKENKI